jgi:hypothetical protein
MQLEKVNIAELFLWDVPVYVRIGRGFLETIEGPHQALMYLLNRWPAERGPHYERAKTTCATVLEQHGSVAEAREAFIAAAIEVHILA